MENVLDPPLRARLAHARDTAVAALLRERNPLGHWTGELSSSALSTATAVTALTLVSRGDPAVGGSGGMGILPMSEGQSRSHGRDARATTAADRLRAPIQRGFDWLVQNQNADGGWGDTTKSLSNISTTTLAWAALGLLAEKNSAATESIAAAERWLARAAGSLEPATLVHAIERRYGADRTFSIPILTMCALCGRLGPGREGWRHVRQLPFELAALPQRWFGALQLPVVSYALPALIAIGQVRHGLRPTRNPLLRALRDRCRERTLEKLARLQPPNSGFLEATPLTSFVTMSLAGLGLMEHPVARRGVEFLVASQRADGDWPIDTNLATWLTTLSVNALAATRGSDAFLSTTERSQIRDSLLRRQFRAVHPSTLAAPGGWAWTDLPGGVPDADDTAGAILALLALAQHTEADRFPGSACVPQAVLVVSPRTAGDVGGTPTPARGTRALPGTGKNRDQPEAPAPKADFAPDDPSAHAASAGALWLCDLQNRDGGVPTFCRGWGTLLFDRSSPDITAHTIRAWSAARPHLAPAAQARIDHGLTRATSFLLKTQRPDGAWIPLWFGHQENPDDENPLYGTARIIPALCVLVEAGRAEIRDALDRALRWLVAQQNPDGGWSGAPGAASSLEESGVALEALATAHANPTNRIALDAALQRGALWLAAAIETERWRTPAPIGLYFAKLWYFERLYPLIFATGALTRLAPLR